MLSLKTPIEEIPRIGTIYQKRLKKLGIKNVRDLLFHFPHRYDDFSKIIPIAKIKLNEVCCIRGKILEIKNSRTWKKRMILTQAVVEDKTGAIKVIWFNQPYLIKTLKPGDTVCLAGKVTFGESGVYLTSPAYEKVYEKEKLIHTGRLVPVYPETESLSSRWLRYILKPLLLKFKDKIPDPLPENLKIQYRLPPLKEALWQIHFPDSLKKAEVSRSRFAFEELFLIQLSVLKERLKLQQEKAIAIPLNIDLMKEFTAVLPFKLTDSQKKSSWQILKDLEKSIPMSRLLEGDVGSGKTVVATMAALNVAKAGYQVAIMAPTEILAKQHFREIPKLLTPFKLKIGLLTGKESKIWDKGKEKKISREELLKEVGVGMNILIGTHSLIQEGVVFKNLALVIVDEQHRFGVAQRAALSRGQTQTNTRTNAESDFLYGDLTYKIRECLFEIRKELGLGHKEIIYQKALAEKFENKKLNFEKEVILPIVYREKKIGIYQPDFVVENKIILELKALPFIGNTERRQIWNYLKGSSYKLAMLVNFSSTDVEIDRIVYDTARDSLRKSASSQRKSANEVIPHLLSMTATPIPRTLALTVYGDLDLSLITEMPKNRKKVKTFVVPPEKREKAYDFIRKQVKEEKGVFVICPRIEPPKNENKDVLGWADVKAVKKEYEKLSKEIFPDLKIGMLHGKVKTKEKEKIMKDFKDGKIDVLVSTSVVEVGIDIPRATVMMIEGAERFGLAQLHQFRGRVGRANFQSFCFLFTDSPAKKTSQRLSALVRCNNGFELAEKDLKIRGPGELYGTRQWGIPDLAMANLSDIFLVEKTRQAAKEILQVDPQLKKYPLLQERLGEFEKRIHLE